MNNCVIAGARGVNRLDAFLANQRAAGLREVDPAELDGVEGGYSPFLAIGLGLLLTISLAPLFVALA
jgi:hypothetical protein